MLTEATMFPNVQRSSPLAFRSLSIQERVRVRLCPVWLTAEDLIGIRDCPKEKPADDIDQAQSYTQSPW